MPIPLDAPEVLNREFLEVRAKILEIAAVLDRIDRAEGAVRDDPRLAKIQRGLDILRSSQGDRAEQIQLTFSLSYESEWRTQFALDKRPGGAPR
jgi:hypothetical protein